MLLEFGALTGTLLLRLVSPAVVGAIVLLVAWRPWRRSARRANGEWGTGLALVVGFLVGFVAHASLLQV